MRASIPGALRKAYKAGKAIKTPLNATKIARIFNELRRNQINSGIE